MSCLLRGSNKRMPMTNFFTQMLPPRGKKEQRGLCIKLASTQTCVYSILPYFSDMLKGQLNDGKMMN